MPSLFLDLLLELVLVDNLLEVPEPLGGVVEYLGLLDALADYFVEDDLEADGDAALLQVVVVLLADFLYFGVLLALSLGALLLHRLYLLRTIIIKLSALFSPYYSMHNTISNTMHDTTLHPHR